jgi:AbrB family looped-hinge helix DNA binding protein
MRITSKGQVTIPAAVRVKAGLMPGTHVDFVVEDGTVRLVKAEPGGEGSRGRRLVRHLRGRGRFPASTDELMKLLRGD